MRKKLPLTKLQSEQLEAIRFFFARPYGPKLKEIGAVLGMTPQGAHKLVRTLIRKRWLVREGNGHGSLRLAE